MKKDDDRIEGQGFMFFSMIRLGEIDKMMHKKTDPVTGPASFNQ
ncbi:hypothetical protein [Siminovitchia acidinfaciens]|nr:hypothetical protein [Siminovitchia acidinfaciens]